MVNTHQSVFWEARGADVSVFFFEKSIKYLLLVKGLGSTKRNLKLFTLPKTVVSVTFTAAILLVNYTNVFSVPVVCLFNDL